MTLFTTVRCRLWLHLRSLGEEAVRETAIATQELNRELRSVYESMNQAILTGNSLYLHTLSMSFFLMFMKILEEIFKVLRQSRPTSPLISPLKTALTVDQKQGLMYISPGGFCNG